MYKRNSHWNDWGGTHGFQSQQWDRRGWLTDEDDGVDAFGYWQQELDKHGVPTGRYLDKYGDPIPYREQELDERGISTGRYLDRDGDAVYADNPRGFRQRKSYVSPANAVLYSGSQARASKSYADGRHEYRHHNIYSHPGHGSNGRTSIFSGGVSQPSPSVGSAHQEGHAETNLSTSTTQPSDDPTVEPEAPATTSDGLEPGTEPGTQVIVREAQASAASTELPVTHDIDVTAQSSTVNGLSTQERAGHPSAATAPVFNQTFIMITPGNFGQWTRDMHLTGLPFSSSQSDPHLIGLPGPSSTTQPRRTLRQNAFRSHWRPKRPCHVLIALGVLTIIGSLAPALWRSTKRDDLSGGFSLGQYILAVGVFAVGCMVAVHSKTCTCWQ